MKIFFKIIEIHNTQYFMSVLINQNRWYIPLTINNVRQNSFFCCLDYFIIKFSFSCITPWLLQISCWYHCIRKDAYINAIGCEYRLRCIYDHAVNLIFWQISFLLSILNPWAVGGDSFIEGYSFDNVESSEEMPFQFFSFHSCYRFIEHCF